MASHVTRLVGRQVKPILSLDRTEAKRRVLNLYKAWYRQIPYIIKDFQAPFTVEASREKLRELFLKNQHVQDIRAIDLLVIKGQMELVETTKRFKQLCHLMNYFQPTVNPKPTDFMSRFLKGHE